MKKSLLVFVIVGTVLVGMLFAASIFQVYQGGTGASSFTAHGVLIGEGSSAIAATAAGTSGQCLISNGSSADPTYQTCAASAHGIATALSCADASGSGTAQTCTTSPTFTPAAKDCINYTPGTKNTGALTLNVNSSSAAPVQKWLGTVLASGDMVSGKTVTACYDGTNWQVMTIGNAPSGGGGGGVNYYPPDWCAGDQTANSPYATTIAMTNYVRAATMFVTGQAASLYCQFHVPTNVTGSPHIVVSFAANDATSGHTTNFTEGDVVGTSNAQTGSFTSGSAQTYTTTSTAWAVVTKTFAVQSTVAAEDILVVKIAASTTGTAPTNDIAVADIKFKVN